MKKAILTVFCMVLASGLLALSGCSAADTPGDNDTITTREFAYSEFTDLEIDAGFSVEIIEDDTYSVRVTASESLFDNLKVQHHNDTLILHVSPLHAQVGSTREVVITMPVLKGLKLSTGAICVIRGFDSAYDFQAELSLGSKLTGDIKADDTYLTMATGSSAVLDGSCNKLVLDTSGGSSANLDDLKAKDATVKLGSGSNATVSVSGIMNVDLSLGSTLFYIGSPTVNSISITGGSRMKQK